MAEGVRSCLKSAMLPDELIDDVMAMCEEQGVTVEDLAQIQAEQLSEQLFLTPDESEKVITEAKKLCDHVEASTEAHEQEAETANDELVQPASEAQDKGMDEEAAPDHRDAAVELADTPVQPNADELAASMGETTVVVVSYSSPAAKDGSAKKVGDNKGTFLKLEVATSPRDSSDGKPSYLRSTASHSARSRLASPPGSPMALHAEASTGPVSSKSKKGSLVSRMSTLLAPTAAFLSRVTSSKDKDKREKVEMEKSLRASQALSKILDSPQGQRVTKAAPFHLASEVRPKSAVLSTDEMQMQEALKNSFKKHEVPKFVREARPVEGFARVQSKPRDPQTLFKPFQLASMEKHNKYKEMREKRLQEEKDKAEAQRVFRAQQLDRKVLVGGVQSPRKADEKRATQVQEFKFSSDDRVKRHKEVLDPQRRARMSQAEREKLEAAERQAAEAERRKAEEAAKAAAEKARQAQIETMDVAEYRKSLSFKARELPDFSSPFRPDAAAAKPITEAQEFRLATDSRLGKSPSLSQREDNAMSLHHTNFASSLRGSGSFGSGSLGSPRSIGRSPLGAGKDSVDVRRSMTLSTGKSQTFRASALSMSVNLSGPNSPRVNSPRVASRMAPQAVNSPRAGAREIGAALELALEVASPRQHLKAAEESGSPVVPASPSAAAVPVC